MNLEFSQIGDYKEIFGVFSLFGFSVILLLLAFGDEKAVMVTADSEDTCLLVDLKVQLGSQRIWNISSLVSSKVRHGMGHLDEEVTRVAWSLINPTDKSLLELAFENWIEFVVELHPVEVFLEREEPCLADEANDSVISVLGVDTVASQATKLVASHVFDDKVGSVGSFDNVAFPLDTFRASHFILLIQFIDWSQFK